MADKKNEASSWKMAQIGLVVKDMEQAVKTLTAMGFGPFVPKLLPPGSTDLIRGNTTESKVDVMRSDIGDMELELIQPVSGNSLHKQYLDEKGEGIQHVMFLVEDLDAELDRLTSVGATIMRRIDFPRDDGSIAGGLAYVNLNTCGFVIELVKKPE